MIVGYLFSSLLSRYLVIIAVKKHGEIYFTADEKGVKKKGGGGGIYLV